MDSLTQISKKLAYDLDLLEWTNWVKQNKFELFRAKQIVEWLYKRHIENWSECSNLSKMLKEKLEQDFIISPFQSIDVKIALDDGTKKAVLTLYDGQKVEAVLMNERDRYTLCISSQVGCAMDCKFCATGKMGFMRNLSCGEILGQWIWACRNSDKKDVDNVVYMGMGEPFLNYDNVLKTLNMLQADWGGSLGARRITVSTVGVLSKIKQFAVDGGQVRLSVSLHGLTDTMRLATMPIHKGYDMQKLKETIQAYYEKSGRRITLEYVLIKGVNDNTIYAQELVRDFKPYVHTMNVIYYNPISQEDFQACSQEETRRFVEAIEYEGMHVTVRFSKGRSIQAACGQLIK